ncbi:hypothetical protein QL285_034091 [Trifolium repens]|nr:hypothetical protein QL285_034091 [Trifolium repens]
MLLDFKGHHTPKRDPYTHSRVAANEMQNHHQKSLQFLRIDYPVVDWKVTVYGNIARPRAIFIFWLACHGRLATKDRLGKFGVTVIIQCCFCLREETLNHLFFGYHVLKAIWCKVLRWLQLDHVPMEWSAELCWITQQSKGREWKTQLLKSDVAEAVYNIWKYRNDVCFGNQVHNTNIEDDIINTIVYRGWMYPKLRGPLTHLLL